MDTEYADAVARYRSEREAADAEIRSARDAYRAETASLAAAVRAARERRGEADRAAAEATALVAETDKAVTELWRALGGFVGPRRTGQVPPAGPAGESADAAAVRARIARAGRLLELARQGELPIDAPRHTEPAAAGIGAALGAAAVALAAWTLTADPGDAVALRRALAAATLFAGVAAGPIVLGAWLSWQYRVRPRPTQTIACVAAAVVATCALAGVFLRGT
ncbi:hypothetical protein [Glycomyces tenuis]|uniref:hypothetical protein n=1 Tax=Glycomyces tenuis TaxID=58116 RepID=UPI000404DCA3|nr:hypothetical protein [Glycomyces tenuis]